MPFIPHTEAEVQEMLAAIGVADIQNLFDEIPESLRIEDLPGIPEGLSEMETTRLVSQRADQDRAGLCFIGAGAYEHHIPAAILDLISRGEFLTAYTPYQAEASQGTLQLIYEYQTMMAQLTAMDVSNASLYDGASALAEAVLMAIRINRNAKSKKVFIPANVHPHYRAVVRSIVGPQDIEIVEVPYDPETGTVTREILNAFLDSRLRGNDGPEGEGGQDFAALVIAQPNFFGALEEVDVLTDWAKDNKLVSIAAVNPTALALLKPPGQWGQEGVDIVCGEGQPLGVPLSSGGPYFGFMCCKQAHVRQMPGRIVGRTVDLEGKPGFTLTLQAREQHIRRSKATSNICTNQGLLVTAATIYMSLLGAEGLRRVAVHSHQNAIALQKQLTAIPGVKSAFSSPIFHEFVLRLEQPAEKVLAELANQGIQGGIDLTPFYPELGSSILVCATETKTPEDIQKYVTLLQKTIPGSLALQCELSLGSH